MSSEITYVVAPDPASFERWCRTHNISVLDHSVKYVRSAKQLQGADPSAVVLTIGWRARSDWRAIYNAVLKLTGRSA